MKFGYFLRLCFIIQILTETFLAIHYTTDVRLALNKVHHICRDVNDG